MLPFRLMTKGLCPFHANFAKTQDPCHSLRLRRIGLHSMRYLETQYNADLVLSMTELELDPFHCRARCLEHSRHQEDSKEPQYWDPPFATPTTDDERRTQGTGDSV